MLRFHLFNGSGRERSMDDRNVDPGLLKYGVRIFQPRGVRYGECAGETSTALCPSPAIALELWSRGVKLLEASYDIILETDDIFRDSVTKSRRHFVERKR